MMGWISPGGVNEQKAIQAAALFISHSGGTIDHVKLVKLMYLLEREALIRWGHPALNDNYFSLKAGPIPSEVCDFINSTETVWSEHIAKEPKNILRLLKSPPFDELSEAEKSLIDSLSEAHRDHDGP